MDREKKLVAGDPVYIQQLDAQSLQPIPTCPHARQYRFQSRTRITRYCVRFFYSLFFSWLFFYFIISLLAFDYVSVYAFSTFGFSKYNDIIIFFFCLL